MRERPRWVKRLDLELAFRSEFASLSESDWKRFLRTRRITSWNRDTLLSLDWPHFCANATTACGGPKGWCYTFQGNQATKGHNRHVAMVDVLARGLPDLFAERVAAEVHAAVADRIIEYPNLRYSGSGELQTAHLPALKRLIGRGVNLWGFTRDLRVADSLRQMGAAVIVSCDGTSPPGFVERAVAAGFPLAYSSSSVADRPPPGALVTFPVHRVGRVREVVDAPNICPKVLADFLEEHRPEGYCQRFCHRCHLKERS